MLLMLGLTLTKSFPFVVKATGELPTDISKRQGKSGLDLEGLEDRKVPGDNLSDFWLMLPDKIPPKQISSILRMASAGNLWNQVMLDRRMQDSWPVYRKCVWELKAAVASTKYIVHPYAAPGQKPTPSAIEKADLVQRCLESFRPDRFADEDGFNGIIFDLADAIINGVSIVELIWNENSIDPNGDKEKTVRAGAWVHPRNYTFTPDGRVGVAYAAEAGAMSFSNLARHDVMDNPSKFLVSKFKSKSGSPLGAGFMRTLAQLWVLVVYPRDFALNYAQKYGNPFLDIAYQAGLASNQTEVTKFEQLAKQAVNQGYFVHPDSAKLVVGAEHKMGGDNAQLALMKLADEQCQLLMLGQTLTTSVGDSGSRALGDVHENVRAERLEELTNWIARILTEQLAESLLIENFGESTERPTVAPDMTRPMSATEQADYLQKVSNSTVPVVMSEIYKRVGMSEPAEGDKVLIRGEPTILEETLTQTDKQEKQFEQQMEMQSAMAEIGGGNEPPMAGASNRKVDVNLILAALAKAEPDEVDELEKLVTAAESASHQNGELKAVEMKVSEILNRSRI